MDIRGFEHRAVLWAAAGMSGFSAQAEESLWPLGEWLNTNELLEWLDENSPPE